MKQKRSLGARISGFFRDIKEHPDALVSALFSTILMGAGQARNKQYKKAAIFFGVLVLFVAIEFLTGGYLYYSAEIANSPAGEDGVFYFFRDYGGLFTKGLWGIFTLGAVVTGQMYRGKIAETFHPRIPWVTADNSVTMMVSGLIAIVILAFFVAIWLVNIRDAYKNRKLINSGFEFKQGKAYLKELYDDSLPVVLLVPIVVLIAFFTVIPVLFSFLLAFTNYTYRVILPDRLIKWVGFANFKQVVSDPAWFSIFGSVLLWTAIFAIMASVTCYALGFVNALAIESKSVKMKKVWRTFLIIPWAIPGMVSLMVFKNAFALDGLVNKILETTNSATGMANFLHTIGLAGTTTTPIEWLSSAQNGTLARVVIVIVNLWLGAPYFMMLITGTLTTIPNDLYEAASIDGATGFKKFSKITLPLVLRGTAPAIIMTFTHNFNNFGAIYYLTGGGPALQYDSVPTSMRVMGGAPGQTDILISWIYKLSFNKNAQLYNIASVYSILIFVTVALFSVVNLSRNKAVWEEQ